MIEVISQSWKITLTPSQAELDIAHSRGWPL